ncbi:MAG: hypothetical protein HUU06_02590 [Planctomycetaceae bacterium]|nr:hypothetical protein [Planctomycetota bacterium]NUN51662.1 hypothetical protein [Planctomycetaceae bacterium]
MKARAWPLLLASVALLAAPSRADFHQTEYNGRGAAFWLMYAFGLANPYLVHGDAKATHFKATKSRGEADLENITFQGEESSFTLSGIDPSGEAGTLQGVLSTKNGKVHQMTAPTDLEGAAAFRQWVVDCMRGNTGTDLGVDTASLKGKLKQGKDGASAVIALKISYSGTTYGGPNSGGRNRGSFKLKATLPESTPD